MFCGTLDFGRCIADRFLRFSISALGCRLRYCITFLSVIDNFHVFLIDLLHKFNIGFSVVIALIKLSELVHLVVLHQVRRDIAATRLRHHELVDDLRILGFLLSDALSERLHRVSDTKLGLLKFQKLVTLVLDELSLLLSFED